MSMIFRHLRLISVLQHNSFNGGGDTAIAKHSCGNRGIPKMHAARVGARPVSSATGPAGDSGCGAQRGQ
jgi:hypothetical protein